MESSDFISTPDEPIEYIYRPYITIDGTKYWAKWYGHKAWKIPVYY